ncbi:MAG: hypothetical protein DLM68_16940 [Hyphomicrobiales bacterium]|nr:MAG: hypothetical protein DLM68_16940 [Hyphomicrobiales bacterium]
MAVKQGETYSDEETARRRDEALLRALNTPPKRHSEMKLGKLKPKAGASPKKRTCSPKERKNPDNV